jgi:hypothetical protein
MSDSRLKDLLRDDTPAKKFAAELRPAPVPSEDTEIYQGFSFGRVGAKPQLMLTVIKLDGLHLVLPYADLRCISSNDPETTFLLEFPGREILVEGTHMLFCFRYLRDHRLNELRELNPSAAFSEAEGTPVIQKITIRRPKPASERVLS